MTTTELDWTTWHAEREEQLRLPHGWLSLTALEWVPEEPTSYPGLPGTWRATGAGVELTAAAADGLVVGGVPVDGTVLLEPTDGLPGELVQVGDRTVEIARRTNAYALRVRDPQAPTRTAFTGVPTFPVEDRWIVDARFTPYPSPRRITVGAVVEGLNHFPTAVGTVRFTLDGLPQELVALAGKPDGLSLHFRDATSGVSTYGGGRILKVGEPGPDGHLQLDLNRVVNLPCAFTAFATCPLPPAENTLTVAVAAGERLPA
ncbi:DUF1684 domain-containing protein [Pseudonocardia sp. WMMC193]|uniref:DUF1684 domain-containing protein n=1 Tax=Pseudonocardia sp. WMMC193 TaxID=2911965 RepID=UPI001F2B6C13|nr:DUF1684 domain-containing protein [Pseudonocardia sp. WMMC193]MCF7553406.1 DUF1684 domain-containing protein [Pseudonocardia sp. WMMC193]